jgi:microcystin-dependent protein
MPFNGSGVYNPPAADFPAVAGTIIYASKFNNVINDIAAALTQTLTRDGQGAATSNMNLGGFRITNVGNGTALTDAANIRQIQNGAFNWCGTAGGDENDITLSASPAIASYAAGQAFVYKSGATANTGNMTVNVNGRGAKAIMSNGQEIAAGQHPANRWFRVTYEGTAFQLEILALGGATSGIVSTIGVAASSDGPDAVPIVVGGPLLTFHMPWNLNLTEQPIITLTDPSTVGEVEFDIKANGTSIFSTLPTIDQDETTTEDAATPSVLSTVSLLRGDVMTVHCTDAGGDDATGLKAMLIGFQDGVVPSGVVGGPGVGGTGSTGGVPTGTISAFGGASPPLGWISCNGAAVSRTVYADLFTAIGTTWGIGDGVTTFNVPDLRGRAVLGSGTGSGLTARTLGASLGAETVTLTGAESGVASHNHTATAGTTGTSGELTVYRSGDGEGLWLALARGIRTEDPPVEIGPTSIAAAHTHTITVNAASAADASAGHANMQPSAVVLWMIKA